MNASKEVRGVVSALTSIWLLSGCGTTTLSDVDRELGAGAFNLWYPAEADVEPGQVWYLTKAGRTEVLKRPTALPTKVVDVKFSSLNKKVDASGALSASA